MYNRYKDKTIKGFNYYSSCSTIQYAFILYIMLKVQLSVYIVSVAMVNCLMYKQAWSPLVIRHWMTSSSNEVV